MHSRTVTVTDSPGRTVTTAGVACRRSGLLDVIVTSTGRDSVLCSSTLWRYT
jgi:hypothetical protein